MSGKESLALSRGKGLGRAIGIEFLTLPAERNGGGQVVTAPLALSIEKGKGRVASDDPWLFLKERKRSGDCVPSGNDTLTFA